MLAAGSTKEELSERNEAGCAADLADCFGCRHAIGDDGDFCVRCVAGEGDVVEADGVITSRERRRPCCRCTGRSLNRLAVPLYPF